MSHCFVVADYQSHPSEGIQVVSKKLIDGLRDRGEEVTVLSPRAAKTWFPRLVARRPGLVIFTHGPGRGVVLISALLRRTTRARIVWVATRPDLALTPRWLRGRRTAHAIVCNSMRTDLMSVAPGAEYIQQMIGIDPDRVASPADGPSGDPWPELSGLGRTIVLHVGHLRRNRGLELLADVKRELGDKVEVVVQGSPTFPPDPGVVENLTTAGVHVRRGFVSCLADLYAAADLYAFPTSPDEGGAIELPLGVLEAVASSRPVLTTDFGVLRKALGGVPGVHLTSPDRFVHDLEAIISDPTMLETKPRGLPEYLNADRVTEAVVRAARIS